MTLSAPFSVFPTMVGYFGYDNPDLRKAVSMAIDRADIIKNKATP